MDSQPVNHDQNLNRRRLQFTRRSAWLAISLFAVVLVVIPFIPFQDIVDRIRYTPEQRKQRHFMQTIMQFEEPSVPFPDDPVIGSLPDREYRELNTKNRGQSRRPTTH